MDVSTVMPARIGQRLGVNRNLGKGYGGKTENARGNADCEIVSHEELPTVAVVRFPSSADAADDRRAR